MNALMLACLMGGQAANPSLIDIGRDVFALKDSAYLVRPGVPVAGEVQEFSWSPNGKTIAFRTLESEPMIDAMVDSLKGRTPAQGQVPNQSLGFYSRATGKIRWASNLPEGAALSRISWLSNDAVVLESRLIATPNPNGSQQTFTFISASNGRATALALPDMGDLDVTFLADPESGLAFALGYPGNNGFAIGSMISPTGQVSPLPASVKEALNQRWYPIEVLKGKGIVFVNWSPEPHARLLTTRLIFEPYVRPDANPLATEEGPIVLNTVAGPLGSSLFIIPSERTSSQQAGARAVPISTQSELAELSPVYDAVAFTSQRMLWIRTFEPITLEAYQAAMELKERTRLMSNAKQIGTALMIFAADNDDNLPVGDPGSAIEPYLRNNELLKGFVFTLPKERSLVAIENPADTEIGHFPYKGGRIVTYADSHVKWVPDK